MDRPLHLQKVEYGTNSITHHLEDGSLGQKDAYHIKDFVAELRALQNISKGRVNKIVFTLVSWRKFIDPYAANSIADIYQGLEDLKAYHTERCTPYTQNTIRDFIVILKRFYIWLVDVNSTYNLNLPSILC
jgi:site-specific recombinase XerD